MGKTNPVTSQKHYLIRRAVSYILILAMLLTFIPESAYAKTDREAAAEVGQEAGPYQAEYQSNGCRITYKTINRWENYANVEISVTNEKWAALDTWQLSFKYASSIENIWEADIQSHQDGTCRIRSQSHQIPIEKNKTATFGFIAKAANGSPCPPEHMELTGDFSQQETGNSRKKVKAAPVQEPDTSAVKEYAAASGPAALPEPATAAPTASPSAPAQTHNPATATLAASPSAPAQTLSPATAAPTASPSAPELTPAPAATALPPEETEIPAGDYTVTGRTTLENDIECRNLSILGGSLSLNGHSITVYGDMEQQGGECSIWDGGITVQGDCRLTSGSLAICGTGSLHVAGQLSLAGNAGIDMTRSWVAGLQVSGDIQISTSRKADMTRGTLRTGGSIIQSEEAAPDSLAAGDAFQIIMDGEEKQEIRLAYPAAATLGDLDIRESAGVTVPDEIHGNNIKGLSRMETGDRLRLHMSNLDLVQDEALDCHVELSGRYVRLNGHTLRIGGSLELDGLWEFYTANGRLAVEGDLGCAVQNKFFVGGTVETDGDLTVTAGQIYAEGSAKIDIRGDVRLAGTGSLYMRIWGGEPRAVIGGSLDITSMGQSLLDGGTLAIGGDLTHHRESAENSLQISRRFNLAMVGEKEQAINLAYPATTSLGNLDLRDSAGVVLPDEIHGNNIMGLSKIKAGDRLRLCMSSLRLTQDEAVDSSVVITGGDVLFNGHTFRTGGNLELDGVRQADLSGGKLTVQGNLHCAVQNSFFISSGTMEVGGDMAATAGQIAINGTAEVEIKKDMKLEGTGYFSMGTNTNSSPRVTIKRNLDISSTARSSCITGTLALGGSLTQHREAAGDSLYMGGGFSFRLNGEEEQAIRLAYPETTSLGNLDLRDSAGVKMPEEIRGYNIMGLSRMKTGETIRLHMENLTTVQDETIRCSTILSGHCSTIRDHTLRVEGNLELDSLEGAAIYSGKLRVQGNLDSTAEQINIGKNADIEIGGSVTVRAGDVYANGSSSTTIKGNLGLSGAATLGIGQWLSPAWVTIGGNLGIAGTARCSCDNGALTTGGNLAVTDAARFRCDQGTLTVGGDLTQQEGCAEDSVQLTDYCRLIMDGAGRQTVDLPHVERIHELDIRQSAGVHLEQDFSGYRLYGIENIMEDGTFVSRFDINWACGSGTIDGSMVCHGQLHLDKYHLKIKGSYIQSDSGSYADNDLYAENGRLEVMGDCTANSGTIHTDQGEIHVHGDTKIKTDAALSMPAGQESRYQSDGDFRTSSRDTAHSQMAGGTLEIKGNLIQTKKAYPETMDMSGTGLVLSGTKKQTVSLNTGSSGLYLCSIDMSRSAGAEFTDPFLHTGGITGFEKIQNSTLTLHESRITLQQDETYNGHLLFLGGYLDCSSHQFHVTGDLEQTGAVFLLNSGSLKTGGKYTMEGASILQMTSPGDLVQVGGDFTTVSTLSHANMLKDGRFELCGSFVQGGDPASFASTGSFTVAFTGEEAQGVKFENIQYSQFANIDPEHAGYHTDDSLSVSVAHFTYSLCLGILEGFQEMLALPELSETAKAVLACLGLSITAGVVLAPAIVLPALALIISVIGTAASAFMAVQAAENIYSTAQGDGTLYEKTRAFAKDGTILVISVIACKKLSAEAIKDTKLVKNILSELKTRTFTSMRYDFRLLQRLGITSLDDALGMTEGKADGEALALLGKEAADYRDTQLKEVVEAIDRVSDEIGGKLDSRQVSRILKELKDNEADNVEDVVKAVLEWWAAEPGRTTPFASQIGSILEEKGLTLPEFHALRKQTVSTLEEAQKATLKAIRESVPFPDSDTLLQKAIPEADIEKYMKGDYTEVGGFIARAADTAHLNTYDEIYESLQLEYPDSDFHPEVDECLGVVRFKTEKVSEIFIPYSKEMGGSAEGRPPFTGNGFIKSESDIIPEYKCNDFLPVSNGAQLIEIRRDGTQTLKAVYNDKARKFVPVKKKGGDTS